MESFLFSYYFLSIFFSFSSESSNFRMVSMKKVRLYSYK